MALQYQFGVIEATDFVLKLVKTLLTVCASEDIQALVIPQLESFGQWILVDSGRLSDGESALHASNNNTRRIGGAIIGLIGDLALEIFRRNTHLTASFVFIAGCTVLGAQRTGHLMHEIIKLRGSTATTRQQVTNAVQKIIGYRDFLPRETPFEVYNHLMTGFSRQSGGQRIVDICDDTDVQYLAKLIYTVLSAVNNPENKAVLITGSRMGIWLASLFVWLRPKEVDVCVNQARIYPIVTDGDEASRSTRLTIDLAPPQPDSRCLWRVQEWRTIPDKTVGDLVTDLKTSNSAAVSRQHPSPAQNAKMHLEAYIAPELLGPIGTLATALVCVAAQEGELCFIGGSSSLVRLDAICAESFLNTYTKAMAIFGWSSMDTQELKNIIGSLPGAAERMGQEASVVMDPMGHLEAIIRTANGDCESSFGSSFLTPVRDGDQQTTVIELGVHLATEALLFSLCETRPANAVYRPCEPSLLIQNARFIYQLAFGAPKYNTSTPNNQGIYCTYSDFRNHAMKAMIQAAEDVRLSDLVVCVGGYAAYQSAFGQLHSGIVTDKRLAASISVCPGGLKIEGAAGNFSKLVEGEPIPGFASRVPRAGPRPVQLLADSGGAFQSFGDADALESGVSVEHMVHVSDERVGVVQILSYLSKPGDGPARSRTMIRTPARWESSVCAIIFAHHCEETFILRHQLERLAALWHRQGKLGENLQWCPVGSDARGLKRCITTTHGEEAVRFFEAGSLSFRGDPIFIRTGGVPLVHCVKEAMEKASGGWVVIA